MDRQKQLRCDRTETIWWLIYCGIGIVTAVLVVYQLVAN